MTQVERPRLNVRRPGAVYGIDLLDHVSVMRGQPAVVDNDYVGQTRQKGRARENQHRDDKCWSDLIVGSSHVLWEGLCTDDELDDIEEHLIRQLGPRMNWVHNERNPRQIPKWIQVEQRHARDDRAGRPRWVPLDQRPAGGLLDQLTPRPWATAPSSKTVEPRTGPPWQQKLALWSTSWVLLAVTVAAGMRAWWLTPTWAPVLVVASVVQVLLVAWSVNGAPLLTARARRRWRRRLRWLR